MKWLKNQVGVITARDTSVSQRFDTLAFIILLITVFTLPILVVPTGVLPLQLFKMTILAFGVLLSLLCWIIARVNERSIAIPNSSVIWAAGALVAGYAVAAILSGSVFRSLVGFGLERDTVLAIVIFVSALVTASLVVRNVQSLLKLQYAALISFLVLGVFQLLRLAFGADTFLPQIFSADPALTLLGSWNDLGVLAGLVLIVSLTGLSFMDKGYKMYKALYAFLILSLFLLTAVNLLILWIIVAVLSVALVGYLLIENVSNFDIKTVIPNIPWKRIAPSGISLIVAVVFIVGGATFGNKVADTIGLSHLDVRPSWSGTIKVGEGVLQDSPVFGVGPNSFARAWVKYKPMAINETAFWSVDFAFGVGFIPTAFITGGALLGVIWIGFLASFIYLGWRLLRRKITDPVHKYLVISFYASALYLWCVSVLYVPQISILTYTFIFTGAVVAVAQLTQTTKVQNVSIGINSIRGFVGLGTLAVMVVIIVGSLGIQVERVYTTAMLTRALNAANNGDFERAEYILNRATLMKNDIRISQIRAKIGINEVATIIAVDSDDIEAQRARFQNALTKTISAAQKAVVLDRENYLNWLLLANIYAELVPLKVEGAYDNALQTYNEAKLRNTTNPAIPLALARLSVSASEMELAHEYINEALILKSNYTDAFYLRSQLAIRDGNTESAIESTESAVISKPNNIGLLFQLGVLQYSQGAYEKVIPVLERAVTINPDYANALYFLGLAYDQVGNAEGARVVFERIALLNPDNTEIQSIVNALKEGRSAFDALGANAPVVSDLETLPVSETR